MAELSERDKELLDEVVKNFHHAVNLQNLREGLADALSTYGSKKRLENERVYGKRYGALKALEAVASFIADAGIERKYLAPLTEISCALQDADNGNQAAITDIKCNRHNDNERSEIYPKRITKPSYKAIKMAKALVALNIIKSFRKLKTGPAADEVARAAVGPSEAERKAFKKLLIDWDKKLPRAGLSPLVGINYQSWLDALTIALKDNKLSAEGVVNKALQAVRETNFD